MTKQSFYRAFRKIASNFQWNIVTGDMLRGELKGTCFCPITALYQVRTGETLPTTMFPHAADKLGISQEDAKIIAYGADDYRMDRAKKCARNALLRAVKIPS